MKSEMEFVEVACVEDLAEGEMIRVDVDGSRVLVAVVEGKPYAMGAVCTHERAFLDEGGVIGHEVTCPLHFSCFDVRTGEVTAPPAEDNAPVYEVKVEDGKVLVSSEPVDEPAGVDETLTPKDDAEAPPATTPAGEAAEETEARFEEAETADEEGAPEVVAVPSAPLLVGPSKTRPTFSERSIGRLGSMSWLRRTSERLTHPASSLRSRPGVLAVLDVLHGRWFGHAIHPPLSDLPIGLWTGAFVLDVAGRNESAKLLGAAGTAGGVAALATGLADWSVTDGPTSGETGARRRSW